MFQIGDTVRIKSWEQLEEEFGLHCEGVIDCEFYFVDADQEYCGTTFTITDIVSKPFQWQGLGFVEQVDHHVGHDAHFLLLSSDVLELVE